MDKIVKHRFWILLALVPPLVVFGYYKANGAIKAATAARTSALDSALTAIPKGDGPNPTWVKAADGGIEIYNEAIKKAVDIEKVRVWTDQLPRMKWPPEMEPFLPRNPQGEVIYRGPLPSEAGYTYKSEYNDQLEALYQSIEPLKRERDGGVSGKVQLSRSAIPRHRFPSMIVPSESMWDAQEDLWLLQVLFDAVRNTNRPAENAAKSAVRRLSSIRLMGGDGQSTVRSMGSAAGPGMGDGRGGDEDGPVGAMPMRDMANMMRGGLGGGRGASVTFDPSEEFGVGFEGMGVAGMTAGDEAFPAGGRARDMDNDMSGAMGAMGAGMGRKEIRYISYTDGAAFRERGFYMSVLIDQKKIADFLVELSNSDWPIRIVRFNVGPNPGATGAYSGPGYMGGGGGRREDMDDAAMPFPGIGGGANMPIDDAAGGGFGNQFDAAGTGFSDDLFTSPLMGSGAGDEADPRGIGMGIGGAAGAYGPTPMVRGDQIQSLFTHPDLVQMDLCGVITMYNPPPPDLYAAVTGKPAVDATTAAPANDTSIPPAGDAAATSAAPADAGAAAADPAAATPDAAVSPDAAASPGAGTAPDTTPPAATEGAATPAEPPAEPPAVDAPPDASVPASGN